MWLIAFFFGSVSEHVSAESRPHLSAPPFALAGEAYQFNEEDIVGSFCFAENDPFEFLEALRLPRNSDIAMPYSVWWNHYGWVQERDRAGLERLLSSKEPCRSVSSAFSSSLPLTPSTLGEEAAFLLSALDTGVFPPGLNSHHDR